MPRPLEALQKGLGTACKSSSAQQPLSDSPPHVPPKEPPGSPDLPTLKLSHFSSKF